ncbi:hypothetical protein CR513_37360, partial [Mucuna pruriens]
MNKEIHDICTKQLKLNHNRGGILPQRDPTLAVLTTRRERPRKDKSPKKGNAPTHGQKEETTPLNLSSSSKSNNIKCFKCLGGKVHCLPIP